MSIRNAIPPLLLAAAMIGQTLAFQQLKSATYDEPLYLQSARAWLGKGDFRLMRERGIAPLPILLEYGLPVYEYEHRDRAAPKADRRVFTEAGLIRDARRGAPVLSGIGMMGIVYAWLLRRRGLGIATLGGALVAFSPTVLAHSALATTDAVFAFCALLGLGAMALHFRLASTVTLALMGIAVGVACSAKYSGAFLLPLAGYTCVRAAMKKGGDEPLGARLRASAVPLLALALVIALVILAAHGFSISDVVAGVRYQVEHSATGHEAYLLGSVSSEGWWYFFPIAFLCKSTPAELALAAALVVGFGVWVARRGPPEFAVELWGIALAIYAASVMTSSINIGHRYLLTLYPILVLASLDLLARLLDERPRGLAVIGALLAASQIASAASIAPHYLAYFNAFVGGPSRGHELLLDSSIDWGQDLVLLARELEASGCRRTAFDYFGTVGPRSYGLSVSRYRPGQTQLEDFDCLAVSITNLHGVYHERPELAELRSLPPDRKAGHSIWIYELANPRVREALGLDLSRSG